MTSNSPTPAGASLPSVGPARPDDTPLAARAAALADVWNADAVRLQAISDMWKAAGEDEYAHVARGRARQLTDCARELRAALEET